MTFCPNDARQLTAAARIGTKQGSKGEGPSAKIRAQLLEASGVQPVAVHDPKPEQLAEFVDPAVAEHCAAVLIKHLRDARKAAAELRPDLSPANQAIFAHQISTDPHVHAAMAAELRKWGLTDEAKKKFFETLWLASLDSRPENEKRSLTAMRLLARGFGLGEQQTKIDAPVVLELAGLDEGLKKMGLGDDDMKGHGVDPSVMLDADGLDDEEAFDA